MLIGLSINLCIFLMRSRPLWYNFSLDLHNLHKSHTKICTKILADINLAVRYGITMGVFLLGSTMCTNMVIMEMLVLTQATPTLFLHATWEWPGDEATLTGEQRR